MNLRSFVMIDELDDLASLLTVPVVNDRGPEASLVLCFFPYDDKNDSQDN